jgi:hypothetical protein
MESLKHFKLLSEEEILEGFFNLGDDRKVIHICHDKHGDDVHIVQHAKDRKSGVPNDYQMTVELYLLEIHPDGNQEDFKEIIKLFKDTFEDAEVENEDNMEICYLVIDTEEKNIWAFSLSKCI